MTVEHLFTCVRINSSWTTLQSYISIAITIIYNIQSVCDPDSLNPPCFEFVPTRWNQYFLRLTSTASTVQCLYLLTILYLMG